MLLLSGAVAVLQAMQARLAPAHRGILSRAVVAGLCYLQPLVRSGQRYATRLFAHSSRRGGPVPAPDGPPLPLNGRQSRSYWTEDGRDRTELLRAAAGVLAKARWGVAYDTGWERWDLRLHADPWSLVEVRSVQEEHGGGKRLIRVAFRARMTRSTIVLATAGVLAALGLAAGSLGFAAGLSVPFLSAVAIVWARGRQLAAQVVAAFDRTAADMNLIACPNEG
jgi:hypothetical protein